MVTLTIFTPAYNRAHTLPRTYESLCRQLNKDFEWLIIDDGSTDDTASLVESWLQDGSKVLTEDGFYGISKTSAFRINYVFQKNQGMHGAHNAAYAHINTELNTCIDSDDYATDDCVDLIVTFWNSLSSEERQEYAGIVGLDVAHGTGDIIGTAFPEGKKSIGLTEFYDAGGKGDKKLVLRTDVVKKYPPYPIFQGEKYVCLATLYYMIERDYSYAILNKALAVVEYQLDGSSLNMYKQYVRNPQGTIYDRTLILKDHPKLLKRVKYCSHFIAAKLIAKEYNIIKSSPALIMTTFLLPLGIMEYFFIMYKFRCNKLMKVK